MTKFVKDLSWYTSWDGEQAQVDFMHRFAKRNAWKKVKHTYMSFFGNLPLKNGSDRLKLETIKQNAYKHF